jgi:hypothetical protein
MSASRHGKVRSMAPAATAVFALASAPVGAAQVRGRRARVKANPFKGLLGDRARGHSHSAARGMLIAFVPSALVWWGIIGAIAALSHHAR